MTPAQRLAIALAAVHAARPTAIRELTLEDIDLPSRRITIAGHRHVLVSRIRALGTRPVSPDYLNKHQPRGISLEHIRRDRILHEALATGADPVHLALVFNIDHTNAMACANAARNLLSSPAGQAPSRRPK